MRPSIDVLFRSAAAAFGPRVTGVMLTGLLDDGTAGLWAVRTAAARRLSRTRRRRYASMPQSAMHHVRVDAAPALPQLAEAIVRSVAQGAAESIAPAPAPLRMETHIALEGNALRAGVMKLGKVSGYTCPDCHGVLVEIEEGSIVRFRCHTGHAFSAKTLLAEVNEAIDAGLWDTLRAIEERVMLLRQMAAKAEASADLTLAGECRRQADDAEARSQPLRDLVLDPKLFGHTPRAGD